MLVLTRNPVADRLDWVVVAACTSRVRGLVSELALGPEDGLPEACVATFDNIYTLPRTAFRRRLARLSDDRMEEACSVLSIALGCG